MKYGRADIEIKFNVRGVLFQQFLARQMEKGAINSFILKLLVRIVLS